MRDYDFRFLFPFKCRSLFEYFYCLPLQKFLAQSQAQKAKQAADAAKK